MVMENQSVVAMNALDIIIKRDVYFFLRMGIRPDLHQKMYPSIPLVLPKKRIIKKVDPEKIVYGEDPYKEIRSKMAPELHKQLYPNEVI